MSKVLKILSIMLAGLFVLYAVVGFFGVPWAITHKLPSKLTEQLSRPVTLQDAGFNPFTFTLQIKGFGVQETDGSPLVGFDELFIDFEAIASLAKQAYTFSKIRLGLPYGLVIVRPDGSLNLADLHPTLESQAGETVPISPETPATDSEGLPPVLIEQISIQQGMLEFQDISLPTPFVAHLVPINITLEHFSTKTGQTNSYTLSAERSAGEKITWEGTMTLNPFQSEGRLVFEEYQLPRLWTYVQDQVRFQIPQGRVNVKGHYRLSATDQGMDVLVDGGTLTVHDLQIQEKGSTERLMTIPLFEVHDVSVDVAKQDVRIPSVGSRDARFIGWVGKDGGVNYQTLFSPVETESQSEQGSKPSSSLGTETSESSSPSANPWKVVIEDLALDNFAIDFEDRQPEEPVKLLLEALHFHTSGVSLDLTNPLPIDLSFQLNQTGKAQFQGSVGMDPLTVDLDLSLSDIDLPVFQPYVAPFVQFSLDDGSLDLKGHTHFQKESTSEPMVTFQGEMEVSRLALEDPTQASPFLKWDALTLRKFDLQVEPTTVGLKEVVLVNPALVLSIDADGGMNMKRLFAPPGTVIQQEVTSVEPLPEAESSGGPPTPVKIGAINITNLLARFADTSITPNVVTQIEGLTGTIKGLSSDQLAKADVKLNGKVDRYAPFHIEGQINPLSENAYTDLVVTIKNFDLPTVSPYSGKYSGYPINKGKLNLDLAYKISEKALVGENKVLIDQITMGKKIESPDATSLPIPLALALLKDRKGQINIDLPVRGNLDDPDFSYGGVIWSALGNLLTKIAASPFALVGGLLGGSGDDLQFVAFQAGQKFMPVPEQDKLNALGKALEDRPGLRLEITGAADPQIDRPALAWAQLRKQLQKKKFVQDPSAAQKGVVVEDIELTAEEEAHLIGEMYVEQFGPLPKTASSSDGKPLVPLTPEELKGKLLASVQIEEAQLRLLAQQRAQNIRDFLNQEARIPGNRVFLIEADLSPVTEGDTVRNPLALAAN